MVLLSVAAAAAAVVVVVGAQEGRWEGLATPAADPILGLKAQFVADPSPEKLEFTIGAYRTEDGEPWVLPCVEEAKKRQGGPTTNHEYLPIEGLASFLDASERLLYGGVGGNSSSLLSPGTTTRSVASVQALSGTGAVRLALEFLARHAKGSSTLMIPKTTWSNHRNIARDAGFQGEALAAYRYLDAATNRLDIGGMLADLEAAPDQSIVLLHLCAHNPSGVDPTLEQWHRIADVVARKKMLPLFDSAYLGFASGDVDRDAKPFRLFVEKNLQPWACVSFSKNFGLYSERVGAVHATVASDDEKRNVVGHVKLIARPLYSNPPAFGARLVATILDDPKLEASWRQSLTVMADRIRSTRSLLRTKLEERTKTPWNHVTDQIGMFSFTGLEKDHVRSLREKHHIYILDNGRVSMAGVNNHNVDKLADAIADVLQEEKEGGEKSEL